MCNKALFIATVLRVSFSDYLQKHKKKRKHVQYAHFFPTPTIHFVASPVTKRNEIWKDPFVEFAKLDLEASEKDFNKKTVDRSLDDTFSEEIIRIKKQQREYKPMVITVTKKHDALIVYALQLLLKAVHPLKNIEFPAAIHRIYQYCKLLTEEGLSLEKIEKANQEILLAPIQLEDILEMPFSTMEISDRIAEKNYAEGAYNRPG